MSHSLEIVETDTLTTPKYSYSNIKTLENAINMIFTEYCTLLFNTVVQWSALSPHSEQVLGMNVLVSRDVSPIFQRQES